MGLVGWGGCGVLCGGGCFWLGCGFWWGWLWCGGVLLLVFLDRGFLWFWFNAWLYFCGLGPGCIPVGVSVGHTAVLWCQGYGGSTRVSFSPLGE
ncbi:hypothetical protein RA276_27490, partial [Pseudomonas syringae pv. tagetis]|uniref:hypothetical protein n=1 Tax=Pseudomonas syringae group genomosp. 7 TaxID=251699 RepID=UPI00377076FD